MHFSHLKSQHVSDAMSNDWLIPFSQASSIGAIAEVRQCWGGSAGALPGIPATLRFMAPRAAGFTDNVIMHCICVSGRAGAGPLWCMQARHAVGACRRMQACNDVYSDDAAVDADFLGKAGMLRVQNSF